MYIVVGRLLSLLFTMFIAWFVYHFWFDSFIVFLSFITLWIIELCELCCVSIFIHVTYRHSSYWVCYNFHLCTLIILLVLYCFTRLYCVFTILAWCSLIMIARFTFRLFVLHIMFIDVVSDSTFTPCYNLLPSCLMSSPSPLPFTRIREYPTVHMLLPNTHMSASLPVSSPLPHPTCLYVVFPR